MAAVHGWWCNSQTFPMECKYCGERIFYFSCDCGSKLFFDELGEPWPQHRCAGFAPKPTLSRLGEEDLSGSLLRYLDQGKVSALSQLIQSNIEGEYLDQVKQAAKRKEQRPARSAWIIKQEPYHGCISTERGLITELSRGANIRKKAGLADRSMGIAMLGKFAHVPMVQMTILTGALAEDEADNCSFTFFAEQTLVDELGLFKGGLVDVDLRGIVISNRHPIWICDAVTELQG